MIKDIEIKNIVGMFEQNLKKFRIEGGKYSKKCCYTEIS